MKQIPNKTARQNNEEHNNSNTFYAEEFNSIIEELKNILIKYNIAFDDNNNNQIANLLSSLGGSKNPAAYYTDVIIEGSVVKIKASNGIETITKYEDGLIIYFKEFFANFAEGYVSFIGIDNLASVMGL